MGARHMARKGQGVCTVQHEIALVLVMCLTASMAALDGETAYRSVRFGCKHVPSVAHIACVALAWTRALEAKVCVHTVHMGMGMGMGTQCERRMRKYV